MPDKLVNLLYKHRFIHFSNKLYKDISNSYVIIEDSYSNDYIEVLTNEGVVIDRFRVNIADLFNLILQHRYRNIDLFKDICNELPEEII